MFGLGNNKNTFLGIDIGTSSIKMVEVKLVEDKPVLSNYAWMPIDKQIRSEATPEYFYTFVAECLRKMRDEAGIKGKDAYVALPSFGGLITLIDFPVMSNDDLEQAIRFEAHKYIPTSMDEVVLSWDILRKETEKEIPSDSSNSQDGDDIMDSNKPNKVQVLLVAASRNKVINYEEMIKKAGLNLKSLELESFSLVNSLIGNDPGNFIIVDIGERVCNIILVEKGVIIINRNIDAGGAEITSTIARSMNLDEEGAQRIKESGKDFFSPNSSLNLPSVEIILGEISRIIDRYFPRDKARNLNGVLLSGGTANLNGLCEFLSENLGVKVTKGNPLARVNYNDKLNPVLEKLGSRFAVSLGAALKGVNKYLK